MRYKKNRAKKAVHGTDSKYVSGCRCEPCVKAHSAYHKKWRQKHLRKLAAEKRLVRKLRKNEIKNNRLKRLYGITLDDYNKMFATQNGCCIICGQHQTKKERSLAVDHDHLTGNVRALLCGGCNTQLGWYEKYMNKINEYLQIHSPHHFKGLING